MLWFIVPVTKITAYNSAGVYDSGLSKKELKNEFITDFVLYPFKIQ